MRAHKYFCVVAYDTPSVKRRNKIVKLLEPHGRRINYSVFECMFSPAGLRNLKLGLSEIVVPNKDVVAIYQICQDCFTKIAYIPQVTHSVQTIVVAD